MKTRNMIVTAPRRTILQESELPEPGAGEVLVENELSAVSVGTEMHWWNHGQGGVSTAFPYETGYSSVGIVKQVGAGVSHVRPGDRVAHQAPHASHSLVRANCYRVPDGVRPEDAAFLTLAAVSLRGIRKARPELGESAVVIGLGVIGQIAVTLVHLHGAIPVIAVDLDPFRLERAAGRGADLTLDAGATPDLPVEVRRHCASDGADIVIEASGNPAVLPTALRLARSAGRVIALGSPRGKVEMDFLDDVHKREVTLVGACQPITPDSEHIYYPWNKPRDRMLLLDLMARGRLSIADLITHRFSPEECQEAYEMLADRPGKALGVVFDWRRC